MKNFFTTSALTLCALALSVPSFAGNKDRSGQAGATELTLNPWGRGNGLFNLNTAGVVGLESMKLNIAGLARTENTEVGLAYTNFLSGSKVSISNGGIAQKVGNFGVLGFNIMSMGFGDITVTDYNNPEGGIGSYKPQFINMTLGFAKSFNEHIFAGISGTFVSEQIANVKANGAAFDAGVQYVTGKRDNFHFGVTLRNVGTNMRYTGGGFSLNGAAPENPTQSMSIQIPTEKFEMPTNLNFGASYDFYLDANKLPSEDAKPKHRATVMANFTSNSFNNDYIGGGIEYSFKDMLMLRGAYRYEKNISDAEQSTTLYTGFAAGATIQTSIGKGGPLLALDYAYKPTRNPNNGIHTFSIRLSTRGKGKSVEGEEGK